MRAISILEKKKKELYNKKITLAKVLWKNHAMEEATQDREEEI